jgi:NAD(P)H-hydrate repair Nnr-like enzyme with NAD(P)H-hydrate dehydratase domain
MGAMLAKRLDAFTAASAAVLLHVRAGQRAAERQGGPGGVIASDVVHALPHSLHAR